MSRSAKFAEASAGTGARTDVVWDDIESEFLGIWLGLARLREKIRHLAAARHRRPGRGVRPNAPSCNP